MPTVSELKDVCRSEGIKGYSRLRKSELVKLCKKKTKPKPKSKQTVKEIKKICRDKGIKGYSKIKEK